MKEIPLRWDFSVFVLGARRETRCRLIELAVWGRQDGPCTRAAGSCMSVLRKGRSGGAEGGELWIWGLADQPREGPVKRTWSSRGNGLGTGKNVVGGLTYDSQGALDGSLPSMEGVPIR